MGNAGTILRQMGEAPAGEPAWGRLFAGFRGAALAVASVVLACSIYANLSFLVHDPVNYRFFSPFQPYVNNNHNWETGGECFQVTRSIVAGDGFVNPFRGPTGPTGWVPPVLPVILAGLLWISAGNMNVVLAVVLVLQLSVLIGTGVLVLALARQTMHRLGPAIVAIAYLGAILCEFRMCFQQCGAGWLKILMLDLLVASFCWLRPLHNWRTACTWGFLGGISAQINPIIGFTWGTLSLMLGYRHRSWRHLVLTILVAGCTLIPWTVRNYLIFGRLIPVKSNLFYELYQSQCLQADGLIDRNTFATHPCHPGSTERREYESLGEAAFLDQKRQRFFRALSAEPLDYARRTADRFLGVTLWYVPFDRTAAATRPGLLWLHRLLYALPFLALLLLLGSTTKLWLCPPQVAAIGIYIVYLLPYVAISYYERYGFPLIAAKVLLILWAADRLLSSWLPAKVDYEMQASQQ